MVKHEIFNENVTTKKKLLWKLEEDDGKLVLQCRNKDDRSIYWWNVLDIRQSGKLCRRRGINGAAINKPGDVDLELNFEGIIQEGY